MADSNSTVGHKTKTFESSTHRAWRSMKARCNNPNVKEFRHYGGRGIKVCDRWNLFANFLADMGIKPEGTELDRRDNSKGYGPENCRWVSKVVQQRNTRLTTFLTYGGVTKPLGDWADSLGMSVSCLKRRINIGWSVDRALTTPVMSVKEAAKLGGMKRWMQESLRKATKPE